MFDEFAIGMRRYGCYLRIQRAFIVHARARLRGATHHLHWGRAYTFSDQHGSSENLQNVQDEDDVEDEAVISALRDVHEDIGRLLQAPASAQKHFADQNPELVALAPNFADLKRRVVNALGTTTARRRISGGRLCPICSARSRRGRGASRRRSSAPRVKSNSRARPPP